MAAAAAAAATSRSTIPEQRGTPATSASASVDPVSRVPTSCSSPPPAAGGGPAQPVASVPATAMARSGSTRFANYSIPMSLNVATTAEEAVATPLAPVPPSSPAQGPAGSLKSPSHTSTTGLATAASMTPDRRTLLPAPPPGAMKHPRGSGAESIGGPTMSRMEGRMLLGSDIDEGVTADLPGCVWGNACVRGGDQ